MVMMFPEFGPIATYCVTRHSKLYPQATTTNNTITRTTNLLLLRGRSRLLVVLGFFRHDL